MIYDREPKAYAGWIKDDIIRGKSSSGGIFSALAHYIIEQNGVICGCVLNDKMEAVHAISEDSADLEGMRGSKYVQSNKSDTFKEIKQYLLDGRKVLFVGTPCECAGLNSFVNHSLTGENRQNLYLCDFICHGVPSPKVFQAYIDDIYQRMTSPVVEFRFRCKDRGWNQSGLQLGTEYKTADGQYRRIYPAFRDSYMCGFLEDIYLRPSCYECRFKSVSQDFCDITIADFWGLNSVDRQLNDSKGVSLILTQSDKGEKLLEALKDKIELHKQDLEAAIKKNPPLKKSAHLPSERKAFWVEFNRKGYSGVSGKFMNTGKWAISTAWRIIGNIIERVLLVLLSLVGIKPSAEQLGAIKQFVQFCIVGVSNALVSYTINILTLTLQKPLSFQYDYVVANVMSFALSVLWSFFWNNRYVFSEGVNARSKGRTLLKAYATYAFSGIVLNNILSTLWIRVLGLSKFLAPILNIPFSMPVNFMISKFWTYKDKNKNG